LELTIKGMLYIENYKRVKENSEFLPPVGVAFDLTDKCNLKCYWCNAQKFRSSNMLSFDHVKKVLNMLKGMGVKSVCYAGGGEPTLHPKLPEILDYTHSYGLECAVSTNGLTLTDKLIDSTIQNCKFVGFSVDASKAETWSKTKGLSKQCFKTVLNNIRRLTHKNKNCHVDVTYKLLLTPENQNEILEACELAYSLGCTSFFVRPVVLNWKLDFDVDKVEQQIRECKKLDSKNFKVYTNFERVKQEDYSKNNNFSKCYASAVLPVLCADGYAYLCVDHRQDVNYRLCEHLKLKDYWGGREHKKLIENVKPANCPRCTLTIYNRQAEAYFNDVFFKNFP